MSQYRQSYLSGGYHLVFEPALLTALHDEEPTFPRCDTHWTHFGAYRYLLAALQQIGLAADAAALGRMRIAVSETVQPGDLGTKAGAPPERLRVHSPAERHAQLVFINGISNEGRIRWYVNAAAPIAARVLVHHDSTADWLVGFLTELYRQVLFIHTPDMDREFIGSLRPDLVLFFQIERFFIRPPSNDLRLTELVGAEEARKGATASAVPFIEEVLRTGLPWPEPFAA